MLWIAYRLRPLTPAPWQWHRGCRLWMARRLLPDTPTSRSCSFHSLLWIAYRLYALTPILCTDLDPQGLWIVYRLLPLTPSLVRYSIAQSCEWLADYYQQHPTMHLDRGCGVVNGLQINTINTGRYQGKLSQAIVNDSQIICTYTFLTHRAPAGGLWMAYRLRPLTPLIKQSNKVSELWMAYRLLSLTPI